MALVTVCVPAYRSGAFIGPTLASIQKQTFADYRVVLALEPDGAAETVAAAAAFLADDRFGYYVNDAVLGYAGNVRSVLGHIDTPYFAVLPHDDLWHPRYLAALLDRLLSRPDASVAFPDIYSFGSASGFRHMALADGSLADRLLSFFLEGAEGQPWRGLTRTAFVDRLFPINQFDGFAVECEWSLGLLLSGPILRVAEPLYIKRQPATESDTSVSVGWRLRMTEDRLRGALAHHRHQLLGALAKAGLEPDERQIIELAAEAATFRRWVLFSNGRFDMTADEETRVQLAISSCERLGTAAARATLARLHVALSRYMAQRGRYELATRYAQLAIEGAPDHQEAVVQQAEMLLRAGRTAEAIVSLRRAAELQPMAMGLAQLDAACARQLANSGLGQGTLRA